jgi:hypothetical protein
VKSDKLVPNPFGRQTSVAVKDEKGAQATAQADAKDEVKRLKEGALRQVPFENINMTNFLKYL